MESSAEQTAETESGVHVLGVGIRDSDNALVVGVDLTPNEQAGLAKAEEFLSNRYPGVHLMAFAGRVAEQGRYNDIAPNWYGGDALLSEDFGGFLATYTAGFGIHISSNHFFTTAGHCGNHTWYNTASNVGTENSTTLVGSTSGTIYDGVYSGYKVDAEKIFAACRNQLRDMDRSEKITPSN